MTTRPSVRTCGNCGATVEASAVICTACGGLLAAYEAPSGSVTHVAVSAFDVPPADMAPASIPTGEVNPPTHPRAFSPGEAIKDARRTLGMAAPEPETPQPSKSIAPKPPQPPVSRIQEVETSAPDPSPAMYPGDTPVIHKQPTPPSTRPPDSGMVSPSSENIGGMSTPTPAQQPNTAAFIMSAVVFIAVLIIGSRIIMPASIIGFVVALITVVSLLRILASATGRKTTTMSRRDPRDRW